MIKIKNEGVIFMVKSKNFYRDKAERILKYANAISND